MVLVCLVAFFGVVAGVNAIMIRAAVSTFGGVETENAYQAGLTFAREIAAAEAQDALHWQVRRQCPRAADATVVEVVARDAAGRPLAGLDASAKLVHPTDRRFDHVVALDERRAGTFRAGRRRRTASGPSSSSSRATAARVFRSRNRVFCGEESHGRERSIFRSS